MLSACGSCRRASKSGICSRPERDLPVEREARLALHAARRHELLDPVSNSAEVEETLLCKIEPGPFVSLPLRKRLVVDPGGTGRGFVGEAIAIIINRLHDAEQRSCRERGR